MDGEDLLCGGDGEEGVTLGLMAGVEASVLGKVLTKKKDEDVMNKREKW